jgi:hypothetical protein
MGLRELVQDIQQVVEGFRNYVKWLEVKWLEGIAGAPPQRPVLPAPEGSRVSGARIVIRRCYESLTLAKKAELLAMKIGKRRQAFIAMLPEQYAAVEYRTLQANCPELFPKRLNSGKWV